MNDIVSFVKTCPLQFSILCVIISCMRLTEVLLVTSINAFVIHLFSALRSKKKKGKAQSRPGQDPGSDPDLVSSGQLPEQALNAVGVQPGTKHDGSVQSLLGGKEDVELVGVALTREQVNITCYCLWKGC